MLAALLFDFDGTIAETERLGHRVAYNAAFAQLGLDWNWDAELYGQLLSIAGGKERMAYYLEHHRPHERHADRAALIAAVHERKQQIFRPLASSIPLRPGVRRLVLEAKAAGLRVAIATTAAPDGVAALFAGDSELRAAFDLIAGGDVVPAKKPAPDIYRYAIKRLNVTPDVCLAVEDTAIGLQSARAAGVATLVTVSEYSRGEDFSGAAAVLSDLGEPGAPAHTLAGPPPPHGLADVAYARELIASNR